jgi:hypothetical protein
MFYLDDLEQLLCTCLPYGFVGLLVCGLWLFCMFLLGRKFAAWRSTIAVARLSGRPPRKKFCLLVGWFVDLWLS